MGLVRKISRLASLAGWIDQYSVSIPRFSQFSLLLMLRLIGQLGMHFRALCDPYSDEQLHKTPKWLWYSFF